MKDKALIRYRVALLALAYVAVSCATTDQIKISPRVSKASIRKKVLQHTPQKSTSRSVLNFVNSQLYRKSYHSVSDNPSPASYKKYVSKLEQKWELEELSTRFSKATPVGHITAPLGYYGILSQTQATVTWFFDSNGTLIDVVVMKLKCPQ